MRALLGRGPARRERRIDANDQYCIPVWDCDEVETYPATLIHVDGQTLTVYGIGAFGWVWFEVGR